MGDADSAFGPSEWQILAPRARPVRYPAGTVLFHQGSRPDLVVAVRAGRVKLTVTSPDGAETLVAVKRPGDVVGELPVIDGQPRSATAEVIEEVEGLALAPSVFLDLLRAHPSLAVKVLGVDGSRVDVESLRVVAHRPSSASVAEELVDHPDERLACAGTP